jgi:3-deoxy-D-manno-octulosonic-acid transferase
MPWIDSVYEWSLRLARAGLETAARGDGKVARGVQGRRQAVAVLEAWSRAERDPARPLVWLHAPSVGEALMAGAIAAAFREQNPLSQIAFTFFSPSAERVASKTGADVATCLPWDVRADVRRSLAALRPDVVAFIRTEVWPTLAREAKRSGARVALLNAPLAAGSSRLQPFARRLLRGAYADLDAVGVVSEQDVQRFAALHVSADRLRVTGDARFDQVHDRVRQLDRAHPLLHALLAGQPIIVAGSTWPADDAVLLDAWQRSPVQGMRLVIAPHEPTSAHIAALETALDRHQLRHARIDHVLAGADAPVLIVDRVGLLADLYSVALAAYVGGGFGDAGLHSVIEPAALGVPVLFGPEHGNAVEGRDLVNAGGGFVVHDATGLAERLATVPFDPRVGEAAAVWVRSRLGGAARNAALLNSLLRV